MTVVDARNVVKFRPGTIVVKDGVAWTRNDDAEWLGLDQDPPKWYGVEVHSSVLMRKGATNNRLIGGTVVFEPKHELKVGDTIKGSQATSDMAGIVLEYRDSIGSYAHLVTTTGSVYGKRPMGLQDLIDSETYTVVYIPDGMKVTV